MLWGVALLGLAVGGTADPRLDQLVDIRAEAVTAPELCRLLSRKIGVEIRADHALDEDFVVLRCKGRPASEVMAKIAQNFTWDWAREGDGYALRPAATFNAEADASRSAYWLRWPASYRDRAASAERSVPISKMLTAQREAAALSATRKRAAEPDVSSPLRKKYQLANPYRPFANEVTASLTDQDLIEMMQSRLIFSSIPKPGQRPFHPAAKLKIATLLGQIKRLRADAKEHLGQPGYQPTGQSVDRRSPSGGTAPMIDATFDPSSVAEVRAVVTPLIYVQIFLLDGRGHILDQSLELTPSPDPTPVRQTITGTRRVGAEWDRFMHATENSGAVSAASKYVDRNRIPGRIAESLDLLIEQGAGFEPLGPIGHYWTEVATQGGFCLVSDAFDQEATDYAPGLGSLIEDAGPDYVLQSEDGWLLRRARFWGELRSEQIPRKTLVSIRARAIEHRGLTLNDGCEFAANLTDAQCRSPLLTSWLGWPKQPYMEPFVRFWGSLDADARRAIERGKGWPMSSLTPTSLNHLERFLMAVAGHATERQEPGCGSVGTGVWDEPELAGRPVPTKQPAIGPIIDDEFTSIPRERWMKQGVIKAICARIPGLIGGVDNTGTFHDPSWLAYWSWKGERLDPSLGARYSWWRNATCDAYRFAIVLPQCQTVQFGMSGLVAGQAAGTAVSSWPPELRRRANWHRQRPRG